MKAGRSKMTSIPAILFVVAQWLLHKRRYLNRSRVDARTLNALITRKGRKSLHARHDVPSPFVAWLQVLAVVDPIRVAELRSQILRVPSCRVSLARERHEVAPNGA